MKQGFNEVVTTEQELRSLLGNPSELVKNKVIKSLDIHCLNFIAKSPFLLMSTSSLSGFCDVSPRGDAPGFVKVLNEKQLIIPERPGNRKIDSMSNILSNPRAGLIFLIPGLDETLRINGRAFVIRDQKILRLMEANGHIPVVGIGIEVEECFVHCAKAFKRSQLWNPESWGEKTTLPSAAQMLADHAKLPGVSTQDIQNVLDESYTKRLY